LTSEGEYELPSGAPFKIVGDFDMTIDKCVTNLTRTLTDPKFDNLMAHIDVLCLVDLQ